MYIQKSIFVLRISIVHAQIRFPVKSERQRMSECEDIVIQKSWHVYIWFWLILVPLKKYAAIWYDARVGVSVVPNSNGRAFCNSVFGVSVSHIPWLTISNALFDNVTDYLDAPPPRSHPHDSEAWCHTWSRVRESSCGIEYLHTLLVRPRRSTVPNVVALFWS